MFVTLKCDILIIELSRWGCQYIIIGLGDDVNFIPFLELIHQKKYNFDFTIVNLRQREKSRFRKVKKI